MSLGALHHLKSLREDCFLPKDWYMLYFNYFSTCYLTLFIIL